MAPDRANPGEGGTLADPLPDALVGEVVAERSPAWKGESRRRSRPGDAGGETGGVAVDVRMDEGTRRKRPVGEAWGCTETKLQVNICSWAWNEDGDEGEDAGEAEGGKGEKK